MEHVSRAKFNKVILNRVICNFQMEAPIKVVLRILCFMEKVGFGCVITRSIRLNLIME